MKRARFTFLFLLLLLAGYPLQGLGKVKIGLKGGVNVSRISFDKGLFQGSNRAGFLLGPTLEVGLPPGFLALDLSLLYDNYRVAMQQQGRTLSETLQYIDLPVNVSANFGWEKVCKFFVSTGPQLAFNISHTHILDGNYSLDNTMLSWNANLGFRLFTHFQVAYTYNIGIGRTAELVHQEASTQDMGQWLHGATHKVTFSYFF